MGEVVQIGDFLFSRKRDSEVPYMRDKACQHRRLELDDRGDVCRCQDCGTQVSAFWALTMLASDYRRERDKLDFAKTQLAEEKNKSLHLLAARKVEKVWRTKDMLPCCPHCGRGISAADGLGSSCVNKHMEQRRRDAARPTPEAKERT